MAFFTVLSLCPHYVPVLFYSLIVSHNADQVDVDLTCLFAPTSMVTSMTDILHLSVVLELIITFPPTIHLRRKNLCTRNYSVNMHILTFPTIFTTAPLGNISQRGSPLIFTFPSRKMVASLATASPHKTEDLKSH